MRLLFLNNPRRWTQAPRTYQSPAEYAEPIHGGPSASYPRGWWLIVGICGAAGIVITALT